VKLTACPSCHAQYDVEGLPGATFRCACGQEVSSTPPTARDAEARRCAACGALVGDGERSCSYCRADVVREPERSGPVCPECYARNPERARHCTACGIPILPQPVRTSDVALACPACPDRPDLGARQIGGMWVYECPLCLGLWTPGDAMDRLVERIREQRRAAGAAPAPPERERRGAWQERVAYRRCPECGANMLRKNFGKRSGVILDWCGGHGTWLDPHEMEDVAAFVLMGGLERGAAAEGSPGGWAMPADPARIQAMVAAERILAEQRARSHAAASGFDREFERKLMKGWRSVGDLLSDLLKR
jgi:Zn-finger nucleic acid-binding protein/ribosomal protein L40E